MLEHARPTVQADDPHREPFLGDVPVLLLLLEDLLDHVEAPGGGEAADGVLVRADLGAEVVEGRRLLELRDQALQAALLVEEVVGRPEGGGRAAGGRRGGGECAPEEAERGGGRSHFLRLSLGTLQQAVGMEVTFGTAKVCEGFGVSGGLRFEGLGLGLKNQP